MRIKKGDIVVIIAGKDRGKQGEIIRVLASKNKVVVKGCNIITKHVKKTAEAAGERIEKEAPLDVSNVMILDGDGKASRIIYSIDKKGKKGRLFQTTKKSIVENFTKV